MYVHEGNDNINDITVLASTVHGYIDDYKNILLQ